MANKSDHPLIYQITQEEDGMTIRQLLQKKFQFSNREISRIKFHNPGITVNSISARVTQYLKEGDLISIPKNMAEDSKALVDSPVSAYSVSQDNSVSSSYGKDFRPLLNDVQILYQNTDLCVVDKPSGLVCHPSHGHYEDSLLCSVANMLSLKDYRCLRCVGRLDKDTSGLVVLAKNRLAAAHLSREREAGTFQKEYLALVHNPFSDREKKGMISYPLQKITIDPPDKTGIKITKMELCSKTEEGLSARTEYEVLCQDRSYALVRFHLLTGRTHQIRIHMAAIGHPLFGDPLYGIPDGGRRAALHAGKISLLLPFTGETVVFHSFRKHMFD